MPTPSSQYALYRVINNVKAGRDISFYLIFILSLLPEIIRILALPLKIEDVINSANIVCILLYFGFDLVIEYVLLPNAQNKRRDDFMDNSFGSKFSTTNPEGYFDNDEVNTGMFKAASNAFENCFFTNSLIKKMTLQKIIIPAVVFLSVFVFGYFGFKKVPIGLSLLQFLFSAAILGDLIKHLALITRLDHIYDKWILLFEDTAKLKTSASDSAILRNIIRYETLIGSIDPGIPEKMFGKHNEALTKAWQAIKGRYKIA